MFLNQDIELRTRKGTYYLMRWHAIPAGKRPYGVPYIALSECVRDSLCSMKLRKALEELKGSYPFNATGDQIAKDLTEIMQQPLPPVYLVDKSALMQPNSNKRVMEWINKAIQSGSDPYSYLRSARQAGYDKFDDNLAAAERYFEGYDANYNKHFIAGSAVLKGVREINVMGYKPFEQLLGRNGSSSIEFVTRWGMMGVFDRENGINAIQRVQGGL